MNLGKFTARAAGAAADAVGEVLGSETYPETEYGLAAVVVCGMNLPPPL